MTGLAKGEDRSLHATVQASRLHCFYAGQSSPAPRRTTVSQLGR